MKDLDISLHDLKQLTQWVKESSDIRELSLSYNGLELFISRNENTRAAVSEAPVAPTAVAPAPVEQENTLNKQASIPTESKASSPTDISAGENEHLITAPMVGTFYMSPKPGDPAFVEVGQSVEPKSVVCIIEVMKLMNNLEAKVNGRVKEIYVEDQQPVEYGQPIMLIEKE